MKPCMMLAIMAVVFGVETALAGPGDAPPVRMDRYGHPLPEAAVARLGTARLQYAEGVAALALSPDGKTLASSGFKVVRASDASGQEMWRGRDGDTGAHLAFSPDGKTLAAVVGPSSFGPSSCCLYDAATGREVCRWALAGGWRDSSRDTICLCFSPDGETLACAHHGRIENLSADDAIIQFWDRTGKEGRRLRSPEGRVDCLAFSPDGKTLATAVREAAVHFWDVASGKELGKVETKLAHWQSLAFAPDGKSLACVSGWDEVLVCEVPSGKTLRTIKADVWPGSVLFFRAGGRQLALAGEDGRVAFLDADAGKELRRLHVPGVKECGESRAPAVAADGKTAAFVGVGGVVILWGLEADAEACPSEGAGGGPALVAASPDGRTVATCGRRVCLWDAATGRLLRPFEDADEPPAALAFSPDGRSLATGDAGTLTVWDAATGRPLRRVKNHGCSPHCLTFVGDGGLLAVAGPADGPVVLLDAATGRPVRTLDAPPPRSVCRLSASPDGKLLAAGDEHGLFRLWKVETGELLPGPYPNAAGRGAVRAFAFTPDGRALAFVGHEAWPRTEAVHVWDVARGQDIPLPPSPGPLGPDVRWPDGRAMAFSPDGKTLAFAARTDAEGGPAMVVVCETATGQVRRRFLAGASSVVALAFSPDGGRLVSGAENSTALLWDVTAPTAEGRARRAASHDDDGQDLWDDLGNADAEKAYEAACLMIADPEKGVGLLRRRLRPVGPAGPKVRRAIHDLDADDFDVREQASADLAGLGEAARAALQEASQSPSVEVRQRAQRLLAGTLAAAAVRDSRAVEALERIHSPEAKALLTKLADGAPEAGLTRDAAAALGRLARRP